jgi:hypothetical protein
MNDTCLPQWTLGTAICFVVVLQSNSKNQNYSHPAYMAVVERMKQIKGRITKRKGR